MLTAAASVLFCLLSSSPAQLPGDISIKLLFGSEATQMHLELVMDFASVKASDRRRIDCAYRLQLRTASHL